MRRSSIGRASNKVNGRRDGGSSGGIRFGVGSLAHLLKNLFYIGEVVYRGGVHRGAHEPILARELFEAVQAKRAANSVARTYSSGVLPPF